ncbi:caspase-6-like [Physella acuta]|uniref:caspase-6-like n=1 Tax=Physella acuta TaxID=109671 RepID=UPI0027DD25CC|nr:caspase-6-like [Physella acuta]XP_059154850.1 caspase-6-like [Physella acuta]XP_059154851.1 caspase-6-like [Physella acuta]XP_059154852.1 caspase-6-like [Physella acuta]XP_059154853.1 caspase-6-like [Physella acuta]
MDPRHKKILQTSYIKLTEELGPGINQVCAELRAKNILTNRMYEDIIEGNITKSAKAEALLNILPTRGPYAFETLYKAALQFELYNVADILKPDRRPHWSAEEATSPDQDTSNSDSTGAMLQPERASVAGSAIANDSTNTLSQTENKLPEKQADQVNTKEYSANASSDISLSALPQNNKPEVVEPQSRLVTSSSYAVPKDWAEKTVVTVTDANMLKLFEEAQADSAKIYKMQNKCRGRAIIFDNEYFDKFKRRNGTAVDKKAMKKLMEDLSFTVKVYDNLKRAKLVTELQYELNLVTDNDECFVVIFLSHGHGGYVFGTDGKMENGIPVNAISVQEIRDMVCKQGKLLNKPKLFFIQACRGGKDDVGIEVVEENYKEAKAVAERLTESETSDGTVPTYADCFIALATTEEYVAIRNIINGSWFIQTVVYVFSKFAHQCDINTLMTKVNECIADKVSSKKTKQMSEVTHTLRKTFYFFPGLLRQSTKDQGRETTS